MGLALHVHCHVLYRGQLDSNSHLLNILLQVTRGIQSIRTRELLRIHDSDICNSICLYRKWDEVIEGLCLLSIDTSNSPNSSFDFDPDWIDTKMGISHNRGSVDHDSYHSRLCPVCEEEDRESILYTCVNWMYSIGNRCSNMVFPCPWKMVPGIMDCRTISKLLYNLLNFLPKFPVWDA